MSYTKEEILAEIQRRKRMAAFERQKARGDFDTKYDPTEGMSKSDKFWAGVGSSATDLGRKAVNLVLPDSLTPEFASDDRIREQAATDEALLKTGAGKTGRLVGDIGLTLMPVGGAARGAAAGGKALVKALGATGKAEKALRYAGTAPGRAVLEGGLQGAWASNPDDGLGAAAGGALLGRGSVALGNLGRKLGATGFAKPSKDALRLENWAAGEGQDLFIPLAGRADKGGLKEVYKTFVPALPGAKSKLAAELERAQGQVRQAAGNATTPFSASGGKITGFADDTQRATGKLIDTMNEGYDQTLNKYVFKINKKDFSDELEAAFEAAGVNPAARAEAKRRVMSIVADNMEANGTITGSSMKQIKHQMQKTLSELAEDKPQVYKALDLAGKKIDSVVEDALSADPARKAAGRLTKAEQEAEIDLGLIQDLDRKWPQAKVLEQASKAAAKKQGGKWLPSQAISGNKTQLARGTAPLQKEMTAAHTTLGGPVYAPTPGGRVLATGMLMGGAGAGAGYAIDGPQGAAVGLGGAVGLGKLMSSPGFQRYLMGNTHWQKLVADALRKGRQADLFGKAPVGRLGRMGAYELMDGAD